MSEKFTAYFERLEGLSTEELDRSVAELVRAENRHVALVIAHIAAISRRKGELERGYPNLFEYCVRRLNLSEGSVALRIQVANVARRFPQVLASLAEGKISLSVAGRLAPHLLEENVERLLQDCAGMSKRAVEEYLVALKPKPAFEPSIRRRPSSATKTEGNSREAEEGTSKTAERSGTAPPLEEARSLPSPAPPGLLEPACLELYNFRFAAGKAFKEKLVRLAEVLGVENPERNMAEVLERALDLALERKDPQERQERRLEREQRRGASSGGPRPGEIRGGNPGASAPAKSRYIPLEVRERVLAKAGYRCEFSGPDGVRCSSRTGLEIEHERPFGIFRSHDERFLRAFCPGHNLLSAERAYGVDFIRQKIDEKKRERASVASEPCAFLRSSIP
jgi:hypothetical protein